MPIMTTDERLDWLEAKCLVQDVELRCLRDALHEVKKGKLLAEFNKAFERLVKLSTLRVVRRLKETDSDKADRLLKCMDAPGFDLSES